MRFFFLYCLLTTFSLSSTKSVAEYYRWVDENGTLHFSDKKPLPAHNIIIETLTLPSVPSTSSKEATPDSPLLSNDNIKVQAKSVKILSPKNHSTLRNNQGDITIIVSTDKPMSQNQSVRAVINNVAFPAQQSFTLLLRNIDRGEHKIRVELFNNGTVISRSETVIVYLHRTINKNSPLSILQFPTVTTP